MFVEGLFHLDKDIPQFKEHLRDFLVQIKVCMYMYLHQPVSIIMLDRNWLFKLVYM